MPQDKPVRAAIVGYGLAGSAFHAPLIASTSGMEIAAIVTRSQGRQEQAHDDFPQAKICSSLDEIFANKSQYDLVVIATPNDTHVDLALASIDAGIAVVVDKPVAISSIEVESLIAASQRANVLVSVFQNRRWDSDFLTVKSLIDKGVLGKITRLESRFERYRLEPKPGSWRETTSVDEGGGLLFDLGSHLIDQALVLFGQPQQVYAEVVHRRARVAGDDDTFIALSFEGEIKAHIWVSMLAPAQGPRFRCIGINGAYEKWGLDSQENALKKGHRPGHLFWGHDHKDDYGKLTTYHNGEKIEERLATLPGAYENFYTAMTAAIASGTPVPVSLADALRCMKVIEAARLSARDKIVVNMRP